MPRRKPTPVATRHGATQPEEEREAEQVKLRLLPATRKLLDAYARRHGVTRSQAVEALLAIARNCED